MNSPIIRAVGFDLDNTLYEPNDNTNKQIREYLCQTVTGFLGRPHEEVHEEFYRIFGGLGSGSKTIVELTGIDRKDAKSWVQKGLEEADVASVLREDPELAVLLSRIHDNYKTYLITSSREEIAVKKFGALGINPVVFDIRLYADNSGNLLRDDGSAFKYISETFGVPLEEMMFVGDREKTDILPANELGMTTAIVNAESDKANYQLAKIHDLEGILL